MSRSPWKKLAIMRMKRFVSMPVRPYDDLSASSGNYLKSCSFFGGKSLLLREGLCMWTKLYYKKTERWKTPFLPGNQSISGSKKTRRVNSRCQFGKPGRARFSTAFRSKRASSCLWPFSLIFWIITGAYHLKICSFDNMWDYNPRSVSSSSSSPFSFSCDQIW